MQQTERRPSAAIRTHFISSMMADSQVYSPVMQRLQSPENSQNGAEEQAAEKSDYEETDLQQDYLTNRRRALRIIFHLCCLLWLAPILWALIANIQATVIGASAFCPNGRCWPDRFAVTDLSKAWRAAAILDHDSHNLLGALQFAAKALEVWFIVVASSAVYLWTMKLAEREEGLPLRYLTWPNEYGDILSTLSRSYWTSARWKKKGEGTSAVALQIFVITTVLICILCNLMGPAVAVLIIPALQWLPTQTHGNLVFDSIKSAAPPDPTKLLNIIADNFLETQCTTEEFIAGNYSCSTDTLGLTLDTLVGTYIAWDNKNGYNYNHGTIQQGTISSLLYNTTDEDIYGTHALWVANRMALKQLDDDYNIIGALANDYDPADLSNFYGIDISTYEVYNRSLDMRIQRYGPMIGVRPNDWYSLQGSNSAWTTYVDQDRSVRCYQGYQVLFSGPLHMRCIQIGSGWNPANKQTSFSIANSYEPLTGQNRPGAIFNITFSDRVASFDDLPAWLDPACLSNMVDGIAPNDTSCDWDLFFEQHIPPMANRSRSVSTWEIWRSDNTTSPVSATDFVAWYNFTQYEVDPSPLTNPPLIARALNVPYQGTPLVIDPGWALVAWSADAFHAIPSNRTAALHLIDEIIKNTEGNGSPVFLSIMHMLSLLPYSTVPSGHIKVDNDHPVLTRNGTIYVYAYALTSRTSKFAVVVAVAGAVVVVAHSAIAILHSRLRYPPSKSLPQLIMAALEHSPLDEFADTKTTDRSVETRFKVKHTDIGPGELVYHRVSSSTSASMNANGNMRGQYLFHTHKTRP